MGYSIQTVVKNGMTTSQQGNDLWMYAAIVELILIIVLCIRLFRIGKKRKRSERDEIKAKVMNEGDIDFTNVIKSSFEAKTLYDELKGKCHPDKFPLDSELNAKATEIFGLLVKNKHDYNALCKLKERAINELNITL